MKPKIHTTVVKHAIYKAFICTGSKVVYEHDCLNATASTMQIEEDIANAFKGTMPQCAIATLVSDFLNAVRIINQFKEKDLQNGSYYPI